MQNLTQALTKSALKGDLDLNIVSQAKILQLNPENDIASASAVLTALIASPGTNLLLGD